MPDKYNLKQFLIDPPNIKIPLASLLFNSIPTVGPFSICKAERDQYFSLDNFKSCTSFFVNLICGIISLHKTGDAEDSYHSFWDDVIKKSFEEFGVNLKSMEFDRNTNNNTCSGKLYF